MPTGYTAALYDGKKTVTLREFALNCARAFGALVVMRDAPADAPIPDEFKPSPYYEAALKEAEAALAKYRAMSPAQASADALAVHEKQLAHWNETRIERAALEARYRGMLKQVQAWQPPSSDHEELKNFMADQLSKSIDFDCRYSLPAPTARTGDEHKAERIASLESEVVRCRDHLAEEQERVNIRNQWLKQLRASLK